MFFVIYFHIIILSCLPLTFTAAASYVFNYMYANMAHAWEGIQVQAPSLSGDSPPPVQPVNADSVPQALLVTSQYDVVFNAWNEKYFQNHYILNLTVWRHENLFEQDDG